MFNIRVFFLAFFVMVSLQGNARAGGAEEVQYLWQITGLNNPESVEYDPGSNTLFISNVNGNPNEKDGNGYISRITPDGHMIAQHWVTGLNAPKGLVVSGNKLYAADIDTLVEIDIPTATITNRYTVSDAKFLNDVTADADGNVYVSDMVMDRIHILHNGVFSIWLESPELLNPNGLLVVGNQMIVCAWGVMTDGFATKVPGHLLSISMTDKTIRPIGNGSPVGNLDGVEPDSDGNFYVTDWMAGKLFHIKKDGSVNLLLTLQQGMADLEYMDNSQIALLPMMADNKLLAYKIE